MKRTLIISILILNAITLSDIPKAGKGKQVIKTFDCEHISGFFRYPEEYTDSVAEFLK